MRVLHVIPSVGPVRGGPSQAVLELCRALNTRGVTCEIATTNDNGPGLLDAPLGTCSEFSDVPVWFFPRFSPKLEPIREFAFSAPFTQWLWRNLANYDLIHVHAFFSYTCTLAMLLARQKQVPYVMSPHGLLCTWSLKQHTLKKKIYLAIIERENLNGSAGIAYTTRQELDEATDLRLEAPRFVLPFGLNLPELMPDARQNLRRHINASEDEPVILFLSRLHPKKGLEPLLAALEKVNRRFAVIVAGSGSADYQSQLRKQVRSSSLYGRIHFVGFAQGTLKQMLLQGADLFALTSHSESLAIAALEAMAAGVPVLITPGVPLASLVQEFDTGWITSLEPSAIALAVATALDSFNQLDTAQSRRQRCRTLAANFGWEHIAARMEDVYISVIDGRQPPSFEGAEFNVENL